MNFLLQIRKKIRLKYNIVFFYRSINPIWRLQSPLKPDLHTQINTLPCKTNVKLVNFIFRKSTQLSLTAAHDITPYQNEFH